MNSGFDMSQYLNIFLDEAEEQLQELDQGIIRLEQQQYDASLLDRIFRAAHTLKGSSASMGFDKMATLTHNMENVLDRLRNKQMEPSVEIVDLLLECLDALKLLKKEIASGENQGVQIDSLSERLKEVVLQEDTFFKESGGSVSAGKLTGEKHPGGRQPGVAIQLQFDDIEKNVIQAAEIKGYQTYHLTVTLQPKCKMKTVRAYIVFNNLKDKCEIIKTIPHTEEIEAENFDDTFEIVLITQEEAVDIINTVQSVAEIASVKLVPVSLLGEEDLGGAEAAAAAEAADVEAGEAKAENKGVQETSPLATGYKESRTVRVDVQRLENLMNLVGELVIDRTRLAKVSAELKVKPGSAELLETMDEVSVHIGRITSDLQEEIMKARMFPIEQVFNRFPRMVRDLARKARKEINFVVEGRETELDRTVIEEIGDPLIHLLRNAIDHGIEDPAERTKLGKPRQGTVGLKAFHHENQIIITIEDDGRGMDPKVISQKAVEKGLVSAETAERLSTREALNLIFWPGFSTAQKISDVSGRGVGMDIVKSHLEKINGTIEIETRQGEGTCFIIKLPLTLAINRSLLVECCQRVLAFPLANVVEIIHLEPGTVKKVQQQEVTVVRGEVLPLLRLDVVLGFCTHERDLNQIDQKMPVVITSFSEKRVGFIVDTLIGEQEVVIKSLGEYTGQISGLAGATVLGDGKVALILDVHSLVRRMGGDENHEFAS